MGKMKAFLDIAILFSMVFCFAGSSSIAGAENFRSISAPEVMDMGEQRNGVLVHVLSKIEYEMQHIAGSINIPIIDMRTTKALPIDKDTPLVFYCMGKR